MEHYPSFQDLIKGQIYSVSELNQRIKDALELEFEYQYVWLQGEISNFKENYASGHWYFSLKDDKSQVSAVCFKWANQYIKFIPENGMEVVCCGQISVYEKQGVYQINVRYIEPKGVGAQALALEQLKEKLLAEGLFDPGRKRPIPFLPQRIGIVTSPTGAAIKDILNVLERRFPNLEVYISPARVQGDEAPKEIVNALSLLYERKDLDLIIVARGGGSKEDLWAFNEEIVVRKIADSTVPLISAIGHEIDITISDLVSDLRASTPSVAAELAVREKELLEKEIFEMQSNINLALINKIENLSEEIDQYFNDMTQLVEIKMELADSELSLLSGKLDVLSPLKVLKRGYSITYRLPQNEVVISSRQLKVGDDLRVKFKTGETICSVKETKS
ncbi:MAG: exodeoxyribonuclease VII large subunit [Thermodesulfobacteriota bacterium]